MNVMDVRLQALDNDLDLFAAQTKAWRDRLPPNIVEHVAIFAGHL